MVFIVSIVSIVPIVFIAPIVPIIYRFLLGIIFFLNHPLLFGGWLVRVADGSSMVGVCR